MGRKNRKRKTETIDRVESVGIIVRLKDGQTREYPLELWQVDFLTEILGFQVRIPDLDDYEMSDERIVSAKMDVFRNAAKKLVIASWTEYWEMKED
ncbi:MAG: hypothetical protein J1E01_00410 [Acetatifactor sp.]|nr:hypothetical protein [Acetatifactor sp.]